MKHESSAAEKLKSDHEKELLLKHKEQREQLEQIKEKKAMKARKETKSGLQAKADEKLRRDRLELKEKFEIEGLKERPK